MRIAYDSNILIYLARGGQSEQDQQKILASRSLFLTLLPIAVMVAPVQSMGEALRVLICKLGKDPSEISAAMTVWQDSFEAVQTTLDVLRAGVKVAAEHRIQHWDAIIVASAVAGGCDILLSEDMQHGFVWQGLTIINPFAEPPHPLLAALL